MRLRGAFGPERPWPEPRPVNSRGLPRGAEGWAHDPYVARYGAERPGRRGEDAGSAGYAPRRGEPDDARRHGEESGFTHGGEPYAYAGQEYGMEGAFEGGVRPGWGLERNGDRRRNFDFDDPGAGQSQAGYGEAAQTHPNPEFDADYLRWREQQLRAHDQDYQDWRREQQQRYDDQYRQFRSERQRHFGQAFLDWRSQRDAMGPAPGPGAEDSEPPNDGRPPRH
jgi:hypothetical protein